jgi:hypothetical protein
MNERDRPFHERNAIAPFANGWRAQSDRAPSPSAMVLARGPLDQRWWWPGLKPGG